MSYQVQRGDPIAQVTQQFNISWKRLQQMNPDAVGHNANLGFFNNKQQNFTIPAGQATATTHRARPRGPAPQEDAGRGRGADTHGPEPTVHQLRLVV